MKKKFLLFVAVAGITSIAISSYRTGAANNGQYDCTGAETGLGNVTGCSTGSGCHSNSATAGINVAIEIDSTGGVPVTQYVPGMVYTVKISGTNTTTNLLPAFGFQISCITGTSAVTTPTNAGAFQTTGLPTKVRYTPAVAGSFVTNVIEQSNDIPATTGTGSTGSTYVESFTWTAPAAGTGAVSFWLALNATDNNTTNDAGDLWNTTHISLTERSSTGVANVNNNIGMTVYPNPVVNTLNIRLDNAAGNYDVAVIDLNGRVIATDNIAASTSINTSDWAAGMYYVVVKGNGATKAVAVVKQ